VQVALDPAQLAGAASTAPARETCSSVIRSCSSPSNSAWASLACTSALPRRTHAPSTATGGPAIAEKRTIHATERIVVTPSSTPSGSDQPHSGNVRKPRPMLNAVTPAMNDAVPIANIRISHTSSRHVIGSVIALRTRCRIVSPRKRWRDSGIGTSASAPRQRSPLAHHCVIQISPSSLGMPISVMISSNDRNGPTKKNVSAKIPDARPSET
jgi:hypothetical protein